MPILQWVNDGDARREAKNVPFHLLERIKTYGTSNENGESENLLVHGDNLIALRALLPFYRGQVNTLILRTTRGAPSSITTTTWNTASGCRLSIRGCSC